MSWYNTQFSPNVVIGVLQIRGLNDNINVGKWINNDSAIVFGLVQNLKFVLTIDVV